MARRGEELVALMPLGESRLVHNVKGRRIHITGANSGKEVLLTASDEEVNLEAVRPRRAKGRKTRNSGSSRYTVITEAIQSGDTLTGIAAKFGTDPSVLKSYNRLYTNQDFHYLNEIKVPVPTYGILSDPLERPRLRDKHTSPDSGVTSSDPDQAKPKVFMTQIGDSYLSDSAEADVESGPDQETEPVFQTVSLKSALKWKHNTNTLLEQLDLNLAAIRSNNSSLKSDMKEVTIAMTQPCIYPLTREKRVREDTYTRLGAISLILFIGVIGVSVVVVILYFTHFL